MKINDSYSVDDLGYSPKGFVRFYDNNGQVIFEKHNMIVNTGRKLIFDMFCKQFGLTTSNSTDPTGFNNLYIVLSQDSTGSQTIATTRYNDIASNEEKYPDSNDKISKTIAVNASDINGYTIDVDTRTITFKISISVDDDLLLNHEFFKFNQIYVYYTNSNNSDANRTLFSRVAMDPVFLSQGTTYELEYTYYF